MAKIAILILAAGESKRLGRPKQLLPYKNTTLLQEAIKKAKKVKYTDTFVVIGAHFKDVFESIRGMTPVVMNKNWSEGMGSSLSKGIDFIRNKNNYDKVLITLSDLPLITETDYQKLIDVSLDTGKRIVLTDYESVSGVPAIFDKSLFDELSNLKDDQGAKPIIKKYKKEVTKAPCTTPFFDVDTEECYKKLLNLS